MDRKGLTELDRSAEELMEYICDSLCRYPRQAGGQAELNQICAECKIHQFVSEIQK